MTGLMAFLGFQCRILYQNYALMCFNLQNFILTLVTILIINLIHILRRTNSVLLEKL